MSQRTMAVLHVLGLMALGQVHGPGSGPWETAKPEEYGLSPAMLQEAEEAISKAVGSRKCFLVVKKGKIVHEKYFGSSEGSTNTAYSTTKSLCSTLFGMSKQQGWGNENTLVKDGVKNTIRCSSGATFKNVLTMTGTSSNIDNPKFSYDLDGTNCYDTLSAYVAENNPEGLSASEFNQKHLFGPLGMEHSKWSGSSKLPCGTGSEMSCRDLARHAQLWLNRGAWPGAGQLVSEEFIKTGSTQVFPNAGGDPYGYGVRLFPGDPIDPGVTYFGGVNIQCAFFSYEHDAIIVTMGSSFLQNCKTKVWPAARESIVSRDHPAWRNSTAPHPAQRPVQA